MIHVNKLDGTAIFINPLHIEFVFEYPDVTVSMLSGRKVVLKSTIEELNHKIIGYYRSIGIGEITKKLSDS